MVHRREVLVLGWKGAPPSLEGFHAQPVTLSGLQSAAAKSHKSRGAVLVVGERAIETMSPQAVLGIARWPGCVAVMVSGHVPLSVGFRWRDAGIREVIDEKDLYSRLRALIELPFRGVVPQEAWAPRIHGDAGKAEHLLQMVADLPELKVQAWAAEAQRSRSAFHDDCQALFVRHPKDVLFDFKDASFRAGRLAGRSEADMVRALEFHNSANLRRAYRTRRRPFPNRAHWQEPVHVMDAQKDYGTHKRTLSKGWGKS